MERFVNSTVYTRITYDGYDKLVRFARIPVGRLREIGFDY